MSINLSKSIIADPNIAHGQPVFANTRIMVWQVLELLEAGQTESEIFEAYPSLPKTAIKDALSYASKNLRGVSYIAFNKTITTADAGLSA